MSNLSLVQWFGGKGGQLRDLLPLIPQTRGYVEPFGGGGTVLLNREPSQLEVYNDLNGEVVNLFRVMQSDLLFDLFAQKVDNTLWSKEEFRYAIGVQKDPMSAKLPPSTLEWTDHLLMIQRAWALYVIQNQGISGTHAKSEGNWSRSKLDNKNTKKWTRLKERLQPIHDRFMQVQIDSQDAMQCMKYWDAEDVTFYVDPPYVLDTRPGSGKQYEEEMEDSDHVRMVECLLDLQGLVVLSGYEHEVYRPLLDAGWRQTFYKATASTKVASAAAGEAKPERVECVYRNPAALATVQQRSLW